MDQDQGVLLLPMLGTDHPREGIPTDEERNEERKEQEYRGGKEGTGCREEIKEERKEIMKVRKGGTAIQMQRKEQENR